MFPRRILCVFPRGTRSIVIPKRRPPKKENQLSWSEKEHKRKVKQEEKEIEDRVKSLEKLTRDLRLEIRRKKDLEKQAEVNRQQLEQLSQSQSQPSSTQLTSSESEVESVYNSLVQTPKRSEISANALFQPASHIIIPETIKEKLGLSIKYLFSKSHQNWSLVFHSIRDAGGFVDVPIKHITKFIQNIPLVERIKHIGVIQQLLQEAAIKPDKLVMDYTMSAYATDAAYIDQVEKTYEQMKVEGFKPTVHTFGHLIKACTKVKDMTKISKYLKEMDEAGIKPGVPIYTNVLHACVEVGEFEKAEEIFDTLKFMSEETKPNDRTYTSMILLQVRKGEIERALDLYHEMVDNQIFISQECLVALARGCATRPEMILRGWDFIFQIYDSGFAPTVKTIEFMIFLSSRDGDLALSRALFNKVFQVGHVTDKCLNFLLLGYLKHDFEKAPSMIANEKGRNFRRNILMSLDFTHAQKNIPLLPVVELTRNEQIIAESNAIWAFAKIHHPHLITTENVCNHLSIRRERSNLEDYKKGYEDNTYSLVLSDEPIIEEPDVQEDVQDQHSTNDITKPSIVAPSIKVERNNYVYVNALSAASKFKSYNFAQEVWTERGRWRKTNEFQRLAPDSKRDLDFKFASSMVLSLTGMGYLDDALAIVESTIRQFDWTFFHLKPLYQAAEIIGDERLKKSVSGICNRNKFYGGDFRQYLQKRD